MEQLKNKCDTNVSINAKYDPIIDSNNQS